MSELAAGIDRCKKNQILTKDDVPVRVINIFCSVAGYRIEALLISWTVEQEFISRKVVDDLSSIQIAGRSIVQ